MPKRCAWGLCNSDSRYDEYGKRPRLDMAGVKFFRFPKLATDPQSCKDWVNACGRKNFTVKDVTNNMYVCSKHFHDNKPTENFPCPRPALQSIGYKEKPSRKLPRKRLAAKDMESATSIQDDESDQIVVSAPTNSMACSTVTKVCVFAL